MFTALLTHLHSKSSEMVAAGVSIGTKHHTTTHTGKGKPCDCNVPTSGRHGSADNLLHVDLRIQVRPVAAVGRAPTRGPPSLNILHVAA